jgi:hypothetical protein
MDTPTWAVVAACLIPCAGVAQQVGDEFAVLPVTFSASQGQWIGASDRAWGEWAFTDHLSSRLDMTLTKLAASPPLAGSPFQPTADWILLGQVGVDAELGEHVEVYVDGLASPPSTQQVDIVAVGHEARLRATSDSYGANASVGYFSGGDSNLEWAVDLLGGWLHIDSRQQVDALVLGGTQTAAAVRAECKASQTAACRALRAALQGEHQVLDQGHLALLPTLILFRDTDLTLGFTYYLYAQDPSALGQFRLATIGGLATTGTAQLAPLVWTVRPEVNQRLGRWALTLYFLHGLYTGNDGITDTLGFKVQVRLGDVRLWTALTANRDVDGSGTVTPSLGLQLGARLRW